MLLGAENLDPFESPGPTPTVGSHVVRFRKAYQFESPGTTPAVESQVVRFRKTYPFESSGPTLAVGFMLSDSGKLTHLIRLVLHPQ